MVRESVNSNNVIDMNTVNLTYNALLENEEEINYKKHIKSLLQSNVSNVLFSRPTCRRKPENIHSDQLNKKLIVDHSNKANDFAAIFEVAKILRRDIMNLKQRKLNGFFDGCKMPKLLTTLLEWVLVGPSPPFTNESVQKTTPKYNINNIASLIVLGQHCTGINFVQCCRRSIRQHYTRKNFFQYCLKFFGTLLHR